MSPFPSLSDWLCTHPFPGVSLQQGPSGGLLDSRLSPGGCRRVPQPRELVVSLRPPPPPLIRT